MNVFLMFRDRDFMLRRELTDVDRAQVQDLGMGALFAAMADGDDFLLEVARSALLSTADNNLDAVRYRQAVLRDCLENPQWVRSLYDIAVTAIRVDKHSYRRVFRSQASSVLRESAEVLQAFVVLLRKLRNISCQHARDIQSEGFRSLLERLQRELDDGYLAVIEHHLQALEFRDGVLISAELEKSGKGRDYLLRQGTTHVDGWWRRLFGPSSSDCVWRVHPRDESGLRALSELRDRGINPVANAIDQSADHILGFFKLLQAELAFYLGCLNLHQQLTRFGSPVCFPEPATMNERRLAFTQLYDVGLTLRFAHPVVGNDINADGKQLILITGANQGGKSTFLRSLGLAQLMMQAGMFVAAEDFRGSLCVRVFTHYRREEDVALESGKLDEELARMSRIVDQITPDSLLLCNESFAATNEHEGSEIARQIVTALLEAHVRIFLVTHLYEFAHGIYSDNIRDVIFLRAERRDGDERTFKMVPGEPLQTSYGEDLYYQAFPTEAPRPPPDSSTGHAP